jgi:murein DD-endopeptidase MepM/ murein hydrolase activator NlpD
MQTVMKSVFVVAVTALVGAASLFSYQQRGTLAGFAPSLSQSSARSQLVAASGAPVLTPANNPLVDRPGASVAATPVASAEHPGSLDIPVVGITVEQLVDTFSDTRGSGLHEAIDIMAPLKTPVVAVDDGPLVKLFDSAAGGLTLYQYDASGSFAYYYAHLDSYAAGLVEGQELKRGELLGYVGVSGNANALAPHLHFAVFQLGPEKRWWQGTAINPYPLFKR